MCVICLWNLSYSRCFLDIEATIVNMPATKPVLCKSYFSICGWQCFVDCDSCVKHINHNKDFTENRSLTDSVNMVNDSIAIFFLHGMIVHMTSARIGWMPLMTLLLISLKIISLVIRMSNSTEWSPIILTSIAILATYAQEPPLDDHAVEGGTDASNQDLVTPDIFWLWPRIQKLIPSYSAISYSYKMVCYTYL